MGKDDPNSVEKSISLENQAARCGTSQRKRLDNMFTSIKRSAEVGVNILNGIVGDYLHEQKNDLAVRMQFYFRNKPLCLKPEALKKAYPNITSKVCILVHGLVNDESIWNFRDDSETTYGSLLQKDMRYTPLYLRYNTGLHISENGKNFSNVLSDLLKAYPTDVKEIILITHSMGGLISRSACYYGTQHRARWVKKVKKIFFLGSPHLGTPFEKFGNVLTNVLKAVPLPYTKLAADVINLRSSGIKDLRFGYVVDEDWAGQNPDAFLQNNKNNIPLLEEVSHYVISGTLTENPEHIVGQWLGDVMVRKSSATGRSKKDKHHIPFPPDHHKEFSKVGHLKLAHFPEVYQQIKLWCQETSPRKDTQ